MAFFLRVLRRLLFMAERRLSVSLPAVSPLRVNGLPTKRLRRSLLSLETEARDYLELHLDRLIHTLQVVPRSDRAGAEVLELGSYLHFTHVMQEELGYSVRAAYLGSVGRTDQRTIRADGQILTEAAVDLFNAERDTWPYETARFSGVLACEVIEHLVRDPMWFLWEANRVLRPEGWLLVTTPNCASYRSLERALLKLENPQVFSRYNSRDPDEPPHVREYTTKELHCALEAAGFSVLGIETAREQGAMSGGWVEQLLKTHGLPDEHRGEQIYCLAERRSVPQERYPHFLYT